MKNSIFVILGATALAVGISACSAASTNTAANVSNRSVNSVSNMGNANSTGNANATTNANVAGHTSSTNNLATPQDTLFTLYNAIVAKDETAVRNTLSKETQKELDSYLKDENAKKAKAKTLTDLLNEYVQESGGAIGKPEVVSQMILGETATLEVKDATTGKVAPMKLIKENDEWKVSMTESAKSTASKSKTKGA